MPGGAGGSGLGEGEREHRHTQVAQAFTNPDEIDIYSKGKAAGHLNCRHLTWMKRNTTTSSKPAVAAWRPRKRHRLAARKWVATKDNMLRVGLGVEGLKHFQPDVKLPLWSKARAKQWPHLHLAQDQGSDGVCGTGVLLRKPEAKINCTEWWDEGHGSQNDFLNHIKKYDLMPFVLVTMCVFNLPFGPEKEKRPTLSPTQVHREAGL